MTLSVNIKFRKLIMNLNLKSLNSSVARAIEKIRPINGFTIHRDFVDCKSTQIAMV